MVVGDLGGTVYATDLSNGTQASGTYQRQVGPRCESCSLGGRPDCEQCRSTRLHRRRRRQHAPSRRGRLSGHQSSSGTQAWTADPGDQPLPAPPPPQRRAGLAGRWATSRVAPMSRQASWARSSSPSTPANGRHLEWLSLVPRRHQLLHPGTGRSVRVGQTDIIEGGARPAPGPDLRLPVPAGRLPPGGQPRPATPGRPRPTVGTLCQYHSTQALDSSPAVGEFFGTSQQIGIVTGTGAGSRRSQRHQQGDRLQRAVQPGLDRLARRLHQSSPALADVLGNGQLQVIEGTSVGGSASSGDGLRPQRRRRRRGLAHRRARAGPRRRWPRRTWAAATRTSSRPTTNGVAILDGKTGAVIQTSLMR